MSGGHGRSPFCNGNFKSADICRTEAGLGNWSRPVSNCQNSLRAWENKTKKINYFAISFVFNCPQTPKLRAKLWIWIIRNWPIQSVQSPATYVHRRRNRIYVEVNYHLEYRQISLTFILYQNRLIPGRVFPYINYTGMCRRKRYSFCAISV